MDPLDDLTQNADEPSIVLSLDGGKLPLIVSLEPSEPERHDVVNLDVALDALNVSVTYLPIGELERLAEFLARVARRWRA